MLTGGKISKDNKKRERKEAENIAAGRPKEEGTGGVLGGIKRKLQEVSTTIQPHRLNGARPIVRPPFPWAMIDG